MADKNRDVWDTHYARPHARQLYPDENVVRILKKEYAHPIQGGTALDLGSGSGRHLPLLGEHFTRTIACDFSLNSLKLYAAENFGALQAALPHLPFADKTFDFVLCWGVLHYLKGDALRPAIAEILRILKPGCGLFLTLRSDTDTHLRSQLVSGDLKDGHADLFSKDETLALFGGFARTSYGFIARQPLGEEHVVAHHMILATR
ncbi:MAG: class I SAM-dependent methyltransferase [Spirochaetes bacterium]|nr:class I SAM-dependent methyltransferase [Spirochaetota bacterium]